MSADGWSGDECIAPLLSRRGPEVGFPETI
uniref:Uncharacterized protein n=1 Tax=Arundo donax TaxID=35708 RepID=A0A0A9EQJ7_ARUDO